MASLHTSLPLYEEFTRGVHTQCCYTLLQLRYLLIWLISIKGIQIGDHEIKIVNFADDTAIPLRDITCLNRIHVVLKLYGDASISKINVSKAKPYGLEHINIELINQDKWNEWSQFFIKILGVNFGNSIPDNSNWGKVIEGIIKRTHIWNRVRISLWGKKIIVNQILFFKLWYIAQIYTIPKYIKKEIGRIYDFLWKGKKIWPPKHLAQFFIWRGGLGILDMDTQLNSLKIKCIQTLLNSTIAVWKDLMLYWLNLILNSNQGLALFRQK